MTLAKRRKLSDGLKLSLPAPSLELIPSPKFHCRRITTPQSVLSPPQSARHSASSIEGLSDLKKLSVIGYGNGGTVYKVRHRKNKSLYALKVIHRHAKNEVAILRVLDSEFTVRCHAVFNYGFVDSNGAGEDMSCVMEYMEAGSLNDILREKGKLPENIISYIAKQVLKGLSYLQRIKIVHGDIKPANLLINHDGDVKIADFGVSHVVAEEGDERESAMGTCAYMSPERFDVDRWGMKQHPDEYAGDVWSLGVTVLECSLGYFPLSPGQKLDWAALMCAICFEKTPKMPETASSEIQSFVSRCLEKDWSKRATVAELLDHPFVNKFTCNSATELVDLAIKV